jgi:protein-S-isoprenylcysteine O-methyltransferase Ste14
MPGRCVIGCCLAYGRRDGAFRFVRLALIAASWLIVLLVVIAIAVLYARIGKEEAMMIEQFGDEYRKYMKRTRRFLPSIRIR